MNDASCPLPQPSGHDESAIIQRLLRSHRIAIVGMSDDPNRPSHYVGKYLLDHGYDIVPVNPRHDAVLGLQCYPLLTEVPGHIDLVNVFRRPRACDEVTRQAIQIGARSESTRLNSS